MCDGAGGANVPLDDLTRQRLNRESQGFRDRLAAKVGWEPPSLYYDRAGQPIGLGDWTHLHEPGYQRVAETQVNESWVSTVWIGQDMGFGMGPPIIFETMIFGGPLGDYQHRYHDEADALVGHLVTVALVESVPLWRKLCWIVADSYREARDAHPGGGWPRLRMGEPKLEPLWKVGT